jgi:hypothetical protein
MKMSVPGSHSKSARSAAEHVNRRPKATAENG